jgi:hypothetical protein
MNYLEKITDEYRIRPYNINQQDTEAEKDIGKDGLSMWSRNRRTCLCHEVTKKKI